MALYIAGFALVVAGLISVMLRAPLFAESIKTSAGLTALLAGMEFVSAAFLVGLGVLALLMCNENYRFFILTAILTILVSIFLGFSIISMFFSEAGPISIVTNVLSVVVMILFIIGFALSSFFHKKDIRRTVWGK